MNFDEIKKEFKVQVKACLDKFATTKENKQVYSIVFDCDSETGGICLRYSNIHMFEEMKKDWDNYAYMYEPYGLNGLFGCKYNSVGDFKMLDIHFEKNVEKFLDSYYFYSIGEYYGEDEPLKTISVNGKDYDENTLQDEMPKIWEKLIIETINELKEELSNIDITDDFIMYMCDHDISNEDFELWIRKTNDAVLIDKLADILD